MKLRPNHCGTPTSRRPARRRRCAPAFAAVAVLTLAFAGGAGAAVGDYPSPLYLSGAASTQVGTSNALVASPGPGTPSATPTATGGAAGALTGTYSYAYTVVDATGGETAVSATSIAATVAAQSITVGNLPTGVTIRLYRKTSGLFTRVATIASNASATYSDNMDDATAATQTVLPQAQNRIPLSTTGYQEFAPGGYAPPSATTAVSGSASTTPTGRGWIVDGPGSVGFAGSASNWTFKAILKQNASSGAARLVVGMWKVTTSGGAISASTLLVDPTCSVAPCGSGAAPGENTTTFVTASGTKTITHTVSVNAFSLLADEHLYLQFWRRQSTAMAFGSSSNQLATMFAYDGTAQITHPAASTPPNDPTPSSPAAASRSMASPALSAGFSDPDAADTGTLTFQVCSDSGCGTVVTSGTATSVANGGTGSWTPGHLADGVYYWRVQAQDPAANLSNWSATRTFVVDNVPPTTPVLASPADTVRTNSTQLGATFADPDSTDTGTLTFQICADAACATVISTGSSSSVASGATGTWTGTATDGVRYWRAMATDAAGNTSGWSSTRSFTLDTTPPAPPNFTIPPDGMHVTAVPSFTSLFADPDDGDTGTLQFQVCSDAACNHVADAGSSVTLTNSGVATWTPGSLADGTYYARVRGVDLAGNASSWSPLRTFTLDRTVPTPPVLGVPDDAARVNATPQLHATFADPDAVDSGTILFELCWDAACGSVIATGPSATLANGGAGTWTPSSLSDGFFYWRARAQDLAGNLSGWSGAHSFTRDTVAPQVPALVTPTDLRVAAAPALAATFDDADKGDSGALSFQLCSDSSCANVVGSGTATGLANGANGTWTPDALADGAYYWRAQAQDVAGNLSSWSATRTFAVDTVAPAVPILLSPKEGVRANGPLLARFTDPDAGDNGTLIFQVCADADCVTVLGGGSSPDVENGTNGSWTTAAADGGIFWRARAEDAAGNQSDWSATRSFTLDKKPPTRPRSFAGSLLGHTLTLRWSAASSGDPIVRYVLYVDGKAGRSVPAHAQSLQVRLRTDDKRSFAVAAVDSAGNTSPLTATLVSVPHLVGLTLVQARAALKDRGLVLTPGKVAATVRASRIVSQRPDPNSMAQTGTAVAVVFAAPIPPVHGGKRR
jgi:hypothetical protein